MKRPDAASAPGTTLAPLFLTVLIDLLGFGLILPLLPFYAETFGASPLDVGLITAAYAAAQFVGAPVLGRLSDRYGRRPLLMTSIFGTALGFVLLGLAEPLGAVVGSPLLVLYASRVLAGLTGGNISVAQAYITDVTDEKGRTRALGMIGAAFGLGFIFGPALGGFLSEYGFAVPAFVAAGLAAVNLGLIAIRLPESLTPERRAAILARARPSLSLGSLVSALSRPTVGVLLQVRFVFGFAFVIFQTVFALYAQYRLGLDARSTSYVLSYVGVLSVVTQAFVVGRLAARVADGTLIVGSIFTMAIGLLAWALVPSLPLLFVVLAPTSIAGGILNTVLNSALTKSVQPEEIGGMLGIGAAVESLTRVAAPTFGGLLLQDLGTSAPGIFGAALLALLLPYAWRQLSGLALSMPPVALVPVPAEESR